MSVWRELKRRDVFRVAAAYLVASWVIVQVIGVLSEPLSLPDVLDTVVVVLLAIGFPFALVAAWIYEVTPEGIRVTHADDEARQRSPASRRLTYVVIGLLVIAVCLMALDNYILRPVSDRSSDVRRIAVLPCADLSPDPTQSFFAAGTHAELINRLGALSGLEVISQTSVLRYADGRTPIRQVADELRVSAVLECFVRYSGDRVLLTAQLIDGESDSGLWSQSYQADMTDLGSLFQIQAEIGMNVANTLRVAFLEAEREALERPPTQAREAYELWLAAREESLASGGGQRALELLERALEIDPEFAEAWSTKSRAQSSMYIGASADREALLADALDAAQRAIALAPDKGDGYRARAQIRAIGHDWLGAERDWLAASERDSSLGEPALFLLSEGYFEAARDALEQVLDDDPLSAEAHYMLLLSHEMLGNAEAADAVYAQGRRLFGGSPWLGDFAFEWMLLGRGELESGYEPLTWSGPLADVPDPIGDPDGGLARLERVVSESDDPTPAALATYAIWAAYFGDAAYALELLDGAVGESGSGLLMLLAWLPVFDEVRRLPEFEDLLTDIGLVDYWRTVGWPDACRQSERGLECV